METRLRIPRDVWIGLASLVLAGLYWGQTQRIPVSPLDGVVNAKAMPHALALALALFSLLLVARALLVEWMTVRAAHAAGTVPAPIEEEGKRFGWAQHAKAAGVLVLGLAYLIALPWIGYLLSMAVLVTVVAIYIGARASLYTVAVGVGVAVTFYMLFVWLLDIPMPAGMWPRLLP